MTNRGIIELRSDEFSGHPVEQAQQALLERNMPRSRHELLMAMESLSRRPEPDVTGVIQHTTAALEGLVRELTGTTKTLGQAAKDLEDLGVPPVLVKASTLYGYASEPRGGGRHGGEELRVDHTEAQLVFHLCAAIIAYLSAKAEGR